MKQFHPKLRAHVRTIWLRQVQVTVRMTLMMMSPVTSSWTCLFSNSLHLATGHYDSSGTPVISTKNQGFHNRLFLSSHALLENSETGAIPEPIYHM